MRANDNRTLEEVRKSYLGPVEYAELQDGKSSAVSYLYNANGRHTIKTRI